MLTRGDNPPDPPQGQAADIGGVRDILLRISRLADDLPQVAELDLNPVDVTGVLQCHLGGMRKPASDDLGAVGEDISGTVQDQDGPLVARCSLERVRMLPGIPPGRS